jgi:hypothetical protein
MSKRKALAVVGTGPGATSGAALWVFGLGTDNQMNTKYWDGSVWHPSQSGWQELGGRFVSPPVVALRDQFTFDIVALGTNNEVYHKYWDGSAWHPSQTAWEALGGVLVSSPEIAGEYSASAPFSPMIFGIGTDNQMYYKYWDNNLWKPSQSGWTSLGGLFVSPPSTAGVETFSPARAMPFNVFALGTANQMLHRYWDGSSWQPADWESLGGTFVNVPAGAGMSSDVQFDIVGLGTDNQLYHKTFLQSTNTWSPETGWEAVNGGFVLVSTPAIVESGVPLNRVDVFGLGTDNQMYNNWKPYFGGKGWNGWARLGGTFNSAPATAFVSLPSANAGSVHVVALGTDNQMYRKYFDGNTWHPDETWEAIGGVFTVPE